MNEVDKRAVIHQVDKINGVRSGNAREKLISKFIKSDDSENALELLKNWMNFRSPLSEKQKRDAIVKYEMWLFDGSNTLTPNFSELPPMVDRFILAGDASKNYRELLTNWEQRTYGTFNNLKEKHIDQFLKKHSLR